MRDTERNLISSFKRRETAQFVHLARREHTPGSLGTTEILSLDKNGYSNTTSTRRVFTPG
jgi:hypothetical protein